MGDIKKLAKECYALAHPRKFDGPHLLEALVAIEFDSIFGKETDYGQITGPIRDAVEQECERQCMSCHWGSRKGNSWYTLRWSFDSGEVLESEAWSGGGNGASKVETALLALKHLLERPVVV